MENQEKIHHHERERVVESKESREEDLTEEAKAAATRERAEYLVKEVKTNAQQIQNIVVHMQQVLSTLEVLRAELHVMHGEDPASIVQDKKHIAKLREKIAAHKKELYEMKDELVAAIMHEEKNKKQTEHAGAVYERARKVVESTLHELSIQE